jgi:hypothetical protein
MNPKNKLSWFLSGVILLPVVSGVFADEAATSAAFTYTDDWVLVSAPPPPGPYRPVNIDPRVPGQDTIPEFSMGMAPAVQADAIPADALANPPAAGHPSAAPTSRDQGSVRQELKNKSRPPVPGPYGRMMPAPPAFNYPGSANYPSQSGYPGYRNMPPFGYYRTPAGRPVEQVPPPPVYDAMLKQQSDKASGGDH